MLSLNFTALRFPIIFGSFLLIAGTSFIYRYVEISIHFGYVMHLQTFRENLMPDLDEARKSLNKQDDIARIELDNMIKTLKK